MSGERRLAPQIAQSRLAGRQAVVDIGRLMGAMEGADAEMQDSDPNRSEIVARPGDVGRQAREALGREAGHFAGSLRARATICVGLTKRSAMRSQTIEVAI